VALRPRAPSRDWESARTPEPSRIIDRETVCEKDYDVVTIGEPTQHVLQLLEGARLFIDVERVRKDVDTLSAGPANTRGS
jgi:hypothetical protein